MASQTPMPAKPNLSRRVTVSQRWNAILFSLLSGRNGDIPISMKADRQPLIASRQRPFLRMALAWALSVALILALFHAMPTAAEAASPLQATLSAGQDSGSTPVPDRMPGHTVHCHCLMHISAQAMAAPIAVPAAFQRAYIVSRDYFRRTADGSQPDKPPRA